MRTQHVFVGVTQQRPQNAANRTTQNNTRKRTNKPLFRELTQLYRHKIEWKNELKFSGYKDTHTPNKYESERHNKQNKEIVRMNIIDTTQHTSRGQIWNWRSSPQHPRQRLTRIALSVSIVVLCYRKTFHLACNSLERDICFHIDSCRSRTHSRESKRKRNPYSYQETNGH